MEKFGTKIDLLPNLYLNEDGTFDLERALNLCGKVAGVCYDEEGFKHIENEPVEKTNKRIEMTLNNGHHSVYDHPGIIFNFQSIPKILAMILNNEHQYTTSEKSARYTKVVRTENSIITPKEEELYNKWLEIFKIEIKNKYGNFHNEAKIRTLSQENARYMVTVFMPTQMIYSTSLRQINLIYAWFKKYIEENRFSVDSFSINLSQAMQEFVSEIEKLNVLVEKLYENNKSRSVSLFEENIPRYSEFFYENGYATQYKGTFAHLAQAQRHRTIDYCMKRLDEKEYFIPPIIERNQELSTEWFKDINSIGSVSPQGELVLINESAPNYKFLLLKWMERLCTGAQLEINNQEKRTLQKCREELKRLGSPAAEELELYSKGARCTFPNYKCTRPCGFPEGITLTRNI